MGFCLDLISNVKTKDKTMVMLLLEDIELIVMGVFRDASSTCVTLAAQPSAGLEMVKLSRV